MGLRHTVGTPRGARLERWCSTATGPDRRPRRGVGALPARGRPAGRDHARPLRAARLRPPQPRHLLVRRDRGGGAGGPLPRQLRRMPALLDGATRLEAQELVTGVILAMVERHANHPVTLAMPAAGAAPSQVRELLQDRFAEDLGADDLARAVGLSRFQVSRQFKEAYGLPPSAYLRQVRLRQARRRLAAGAAIAEVAAATGFADQSHLTRWFRRAYGITPAVYQRGAATLA